MLITHISILDTLLQYSKISNMPIIKNKILPIGKKFYAINLFGIIFAKGECNRIVINHEKIHTHQMLELLILPFYLIYVIEWLIKIIIYRDSIRAYMNISFEREAYKNERDFSYLKKRRLFSFLRYFK